ncbi:MAG: transposase [Methylococcales bacterium]|nr:transposase [Methylococcales bacterium]
MKAICADYSNLATSALDGGYSKEPAFLRGVDEQGCRFVADAHCDQTINLQDPEPLAPEWSDRGRQPLHRKPQSAAQRVDQWAAAQPADAWRQLTLREGEKASWLPITCMTRLGFGMAKNNRRAAGISWCAGKPALEHPLPRRQLAAEEVAEIISKRHYLRRKAKESHARRCQAVCE